MRVRMKIRKTLMKESASELQKKGLLVMKSSLIVKMKGMAEEMFALIVQKRNTRVMILKCLRKKQILNVSFFMMCVQLTINLKLELYGAR